jgi:hypothetical protein
LPYLLHLLLQVSLCLCQLLLLHDAQLLQLLGQLGLHRDQLVVLVHRGLLGSHSLGTHLRRRLTRAHCHNAWELVLGGRGGGATTSCCPTLTATCGTCAARAPLNWLIILVLILTPGSPAAALTAGTR